MAALSQDFKTQRRVPANHRRLRDFGLGLACGVLLSAIVFAWLGARTRPTLVQAAPAVQRPQPVPRSEADVGTLTFPEVLARTTVPVFPTDGSARHTPPPAAHHGPTR